MRKQRLCVFLAMICILALLLPLTAFAQENGWYHDGNGYCYYENGYKVRNEVKLIYSHEYGCDMYYGFDYAGYMYADQSFYCDGEYYRASVDGSLYTNTWYQDGYDNWYYNGADGARAQSEVLWINGAYYGFGYDGMMFTDSSFGVGGDYYRAHEDGTLYAGQWYETSWGDWYYYCDDAKAARDFELINNTWYFFDYEGEMITDQLVLSEDGYYYYIGKNGDTYQQLFDGWNAVGADWYYLEDGYPVYHEIRKLYSGDYGCEMYYYFANGKMVTDGMYYGEYNVFARKDGTLYVNQWYQDASGEWYYFGDKGIGAKDFTQIGGIWYFFEYDSRMMKDTHVYSAIEDLHYILSQDGTQYQRAELGWNYAFGHWYYTRGPQKYEAFAGGMHFLEDEILTENGVKYYFDYEGKMITNQSIYYNGNTYVADSNGVLQSSGWFQENGCWKYLIDGVLCRENAYNIDGVLYGFDWDGEMYTFGGEQYINGDEYYVSDGSGVLYRNQWRYREITSPYEIGWVYYGDDGAMLTNTVANIDGVWYGFDYNGAQATNTILGGDGVACLIDAYGYGQVLSDGWYQHPETERWMYVENGELAEGILTINGVTYGFENGYMLTGSYIHGVINDVEGLYLFDYDGHLCAAPGWYSMERWFYVQDNGTLAEGWLQIDSKWYKFTPEMIFNTVFFDEEEGRCYVATADGVCIAVQGQGLQTVQYTYDAYYSERITVYIENGNAVKDAWRQVNGFWYYFSESGFAIRGGECEIGENRYLFDSYGKLLQNGWYNNYETWYYADPNNGGALVTGLQQIGGVQYLFNSYGAMFNNGLYSDENGHYVIDNGGRILATLSAEGWNQVGGDWYYVRDGYPVTSGIEKIDGAYYGFDEKGKMLSGGIKSLYSWSSTKYLFANDGTILTGWNMVNGHWVYAHDDSSPRLERYSCTMIDGKKYIFDENAYMITGTAVLDEHIYTTDESGVVISEVAYADGWCYQDGNWYYKQDGAPYTGWLGDHLIMNGQMRYCTSIEYNGQWYYITANGLCLRNGWYEAYEDEWVLAKADGTLYCSQWVQVNGAWYYFSGTTMLRDGIFYIETDEEVHKFAEDGKWLGKYTSNVEIGEGVKIPYVENGWSQGNNGKWYYYHCGNIVSGQRYIDGKWYYLSAAMLTDTVYGSYYYGSDGAAVEYTGWQMIDGHWYYFNPDHTLYFGLLQDGNSWYYLERCMDEIDEEEEYFDDYYYYMDADRKRYSDLLKDGYYSQGKALYYFDSNGRSSGPISAEGWYDANGEWYYFEDGALVSGYREIGGVGYYFNSEMATEFITYVNGNSRFFGTNGAMVTAKGWYQLGDKWIYVNEYGYLYAVGIYSIDGVEYTFRDWYWVS